MNIESIELAGQQDYAEAGGAFPLIYAAEGAPDLEASLAWLADNRERLLSELATHGALLLRGFKVASDRDFDRLIQRFELPNFTYADSLSNAVRRNRTERVFTANEAPPQVSIYLHHEMAQTPVFPSKLFFFCEKAQMTGGATPLCRSDILLARLAASRPEFVAACEALGVRYSNSMPATDDPSSGQGRSWRSTLSVDTAQEAEAKLMALNYSWEWQAQEVLRVTTPALPAVRQLADGRKVFFNQLIAAFRGWKDARNDAEKSIRLGDGSSIDPADMAVAIELADELSFDIPWQAGDVALIDNFLVMHGRRPFRGERAVLASLVA